LKAKSTLFALVALILWSNTSTGQLPIPRFGVVGGVSHYDFGATGTTPFGALRVELPLVALVAEGSLGAFRPEEGGERRTYVIPEAQLQWQIFPVVVRPYLGAGVGWLKAISGPTPRRDDMTISASAGVRVGLPMLGFGLRGEVRVRTIGSELTVRATEYTIGVIR